MRTMNPIHDASCSVVACAEILGAKWTAVLVHDPLFDDLVDNALTELAHPPVRIRAGGEYESRIADASPQAITPDDERALLSINYTSGTTGRPKGVMYHHRRDG